MLNEETTTTTTTGETIMLTVTHEYVGFSDFWGGNGKRWNDNAGCLFAYYGSSTTLQGCVDQWIDDFMVGGDCEMFPDDITRDDILAAILDWFTQQGRDDYHSGALAECAVGIICPYCGGNCNDKHGCDGYEGDIDGLLENDDSPIWIILVECEVGEECDECDNAVGSPHHSSCGKRTIDCPTVIRDDC